MFTFLQYFNNYLSKFESKIWTHTCYAKQWPSLQVQCLIQSPRSSLKSRAIDNNCRSVSQMRRALCNLLSS